MAIKSQYSNKCKDCGTKYEVGDEIDTNGNKSPNKMGEMKDHWCKMGKNCQGAMQTKGIDFSKMNKDEASKDPTPEQFLELGKAILKKHVPEMKDSVIEQEILSTDAKIAWMLIRRSRIEKVMNDLGLQHPSRIAFIKDVLR